jgi:hypothetical protein
MDYQRAQRETLLTKSRVSALTEEEKQRLRELYRTPHVEPGNDS